MEVSGRNETVDVAFADVIQVPQIDDPAVLQQGSDQRL